MKYATDWHAVEDDLASIWLSATDRDDITAASSALDELLKHDPLRVGEARDGNTRILIVRPLAIYFDVIPDDMRVVVWQLWRWSS